MTTMSYGETPPIHDELAAPGLLMAMEVGRREWKLGFTTGIGRTMRRRTLRADSWRRVAEEIAAAKGRFGLSADAPVMSCYEAGMDGFWVHRYLTGLSVKNLVVVGGEFPNCSPERTRLAVTPPESDAASGFTQDAERGGISSGQHDARFGGCPVHAAIGV